MEITITIIGIMLFVSVPFIVAALGAWFLQSRVRRSVERYAKAHRQSSSPGPPRPRDEPRQPKAPLRIVNEAPKPDNKFWRILRGRARRFRFASALVSILGGAVCASVMAFGDGRIGSNHLLTIEAARATLLLSHLWPFAITALAVVLYSRRAKFVLMPLTLVILGWLAVDAGERSWLALLYVAPATFILLVTVNRRLKTTAPLMTIVTLGLLLCGSLAAFAGVSAYEQLKDELWGTAIGLVTLVVTGLIGLRLLWGFVIVRYRKQKFSDQSFQLAFVWLVFCVSYCFTRLDVKVWRWGLIAFGAYWVTLTVLRWGLRLSTQWRNPASLLVLRVFGSGKGEMLFEELGARWRSTGPVYVIAGHDSAETNLDLDEAFHYLLFRFRKLYIGNTADLQERLKKIDVPPRPDGDGRFRTIDFFCFHDTWQPTFESLAGSRSSAVLVDVTGWKNSDSGVAFELRYLFERRRLDSFVLMTGRIGDDEYQHLESALQELWAGIDPRDPTAANPTVCLLRDPTPKRVMTALSHAAIAGGWTPHRAGAPAAIAAPAGA